MYGAVSDVAPRQVVTPLAVVQTGFALATVGAATSKDAASAARLTAMVFFITYTIGAAGPFIAGTLLDFFDSWSLVFTVLGCAGLLQLLTIIPLRRDVHVD